jgi:voltage-gated potassium channel Kch
MDASITTIGAIAMQGVRQCNPLIGETIVVVGLGLIGQLTALILKANGVRVIGIETNTARIKLALANGIKDIINPSAKVRIKENDDIPGIQTTQVTRPLIISSLNSYMREGKIKINSVRLLEEFDTFIYNGNKPEHADGFNDDLIFALGVLLFVRDTEYFKHFASRDLYKAMIGSISNQKTGIEEKINLDAKSTEGVILTSRNTKADDDNDISWLISS